MSNSALLSRKCFNSALIGWGAVLLLIVLQNLVGVGAVMPIRYWRYVVPVAVVFLSVGACCGIASLFRMEAEEWKSVVFSSILGILLDAALIVFLVGATLLAMLPR